MKSFFSFMQRLTLHAYVAVFVLAILCFSGVLFFLGYKDNISLILKYTLIIGSLPLWYGLIRDMFRGSFGVDIIAGVALIGTFFIKEYFAGVIVLLMLSGGQLLEVYAMRRARRELSTLLSKTPEYAHVKHNDIISDIPIESVTVGTLVVIKAGEVVSVDGVIVEGQTMIDESTLTGESVPIKKQVGSSVYTGTQNIDGVIVVRVEKSATETRYQSIIALVKQAEESKAPLVRLADLYSIYFTVITFTIAAITWVVSHDIMRVVSVLVVATPCPLILATPIAIMSGMSKSSARGVIVKDGGALETLSRVTTFVFDKTGTVTLGTPEVSKVISFGDISEEHILSTAASLDQLSTHILARALTDYAHTKNIVLSYPIDFKEEFGDGVSGTVEGVTYLFGKKAFVSKSNPISQKVIDVYTHASEQGMIAVFLADTKNILGAILFEDTLRTDAQDLFTKLHAEGVKKTVMITGDKHERAMHVSQALRISDVISECLPDDKLHHVQQFQKDNHIVAMVGDGVNDAPALAQSNVGIALGTHGKTATSDVADIVVLSQSVGRVYDVWHIARKTIFLAKQGIFIGIGASIFAMILSSFGYITPVWGAILQEGIDVVVILNALRLGSTLSLKD